MFNFGRRKRAEKYMDDVSAYISKKYKYDYESYIRYAIPDKDVVEDSKNDDISFNLKSDPNRSKSTQTTQTINFEALNKILNISVKKTFVDVLLHHIDKSGLKDSEVYKSAQIDKRLFSKIVSNREYKPSKDTVISFAIALKLSLNDTQDMLACAGYVLSHSSKRDIIVEYFFKKGIYNLMDMNDVLYSMNQKIIGRY